jgi:hypothetical protein
MAFIILFLIILLRLYLHLPEINQQVYFDFGSGFAFEAPAWGSWDGFKGYESETGFFVGSKALLGLVAKARFVGAGAFAVDDGASAGPEIFDVF